MAAYREVWLPWTDSNMTDEDYARFMRLPRYERELDIVYVKPLESRHAEAPAQTSAYLRLARS